MKRLDINAYIPLDKSWIIRLGVLDIINGHDHVKQFLSSQDYLGDDLLALKRAAEDWESGLLIDIGESGILYRFLQFASWKHGLNKKFIRRGSLLSRVVNSNPKIVVLTQSELLKLDNGTSQWASASAILGDEERLKDAPFKLELTYEAIDHWKKKINVGQPCQPRLDATILRQAKAFIEILEGGKPKFIPKQSEDFCFAYVFGYINASDGAKIWPSLRTHESNRVIEVQKALKAVRENKAVLSKDHRVVQAVTMWAKANGRAAKISHLSSVNKSWPRFWDFIGASG